MALKINRLTMSVLFLATAWSTGAHALLVDSFDTDAEAAVTTAAPDSDSAATPDDATMVGDRVITTDKTAGPAGFAQGSFATVIDGFLSMANGPSTNSDITVAWTFATTDLTEGGTQTGIVVQLPDPIDNDLNVAFSINGGPPLSILIPDGSSGDSFIFAFADIANNADAAAATSLSVTFSNGVAWDARVDFIETRGPGVPPPSGPTPKVPTMSIHAPGLTMLGLMVIAANKLSRRKARHTRNQ